MKEFRISNFGLRILSEPISSFGVGLLIKLKVGRQRQLHKIRMR